MQSTLFRGSAIKPIRQKFVRKKYVRREGQISLEAEQNSEVQRPEENHLAAEQDSDHIAAMFLPLIFLPISLMVLLLTNLQSCRRSATREPRFHCTWDWHPRLSPAIATRFKLHRSITDPVIKSTLHDYLSGRKMCGKNNICAVNNSMGCGEHEYKTSQQKDGRYKILVVKNSLRFGGTSLCVHRFAANTALGQNLHHMAAIYFCHSFFCRYLAHLRDLVHVQFLTKPAIFSRN